MNAKKYLVKKIVTMTWEIEANSLKEAKTISEYLSEWSAGASAKISVKEIKQS